METRRPIQASLPETQVINEEDKFCFIKTIELSPTPLYRAINFNTKVHDKNVFIAAQTSVQNIANRENIQLEANNHMFNHGPILTVLGAGIRTEQVKAITPNVKVIVLTDEFFQYYLTSIKKYENAIAILSAIPSTIRWVVFPGESYFLVQDFLKSNLPFHLTIYAYKPSGWQNHKGGKYRMIRARSVAVASAEVSSLDYAQAAFSEKNTMKNTIVNHIIDLTQDENDTQTAYTTTNTKMMNASPIEMNYFTAEFDSSSINVAEEYFIEMGEKLRKNIERDIETEEEEIDSEEGVDSEAVPHVDREKIQYFTSQTVEQIPHQMTSALLPVQATLLPPSIVRVNSQKRAREKQYDELVNRYIHEYAQVLAENKNHQIEFDTSVPFNRALRDLNGYFEDLEKARKPSKRIAIANEKDKPIRKRVAEHTDDCIDFASTLVEKLKLGLQAHLALIGKEIIFTNKTQSATSASGDAKEYRRDTHKNKPYQSNGGLNNLGGQYCPYPGVRLFDPHAKTAYGLTPAVAPKLVPALPSQAAPEAKPASKSEERSWPSTRNTMSVTRPMYKLPGLNRLGASNSASHAHLPDRVLKKMEEKRKEKESSNVIASQTKKSFFK